MSVVKTTIKLQIKNQQAIYMGQHKQSIIDSEFEGFLQELVDYNLLDSDGIKLCIVRLAVEFGVESLSEQQNWLLKETVINNYVTEECIFCGGDIPWSEMILAIDTKMCGYCLHKMAKVNDAD